MEGCKRGGKAHPCVGRDDICSSIGTGLLSTKAMLEDGTTRDGFRAGRRDKKKTEWRSDRRLSGHPRPRQPSLLERARRGGKEERRPRRTTTEGAANLGNQCNAPIPRWETTTQNALGTTPSHTLKWPGDECSPSTNININISRGGGGGGNPRPSAAGKTEIPGSQTPLPTSLVCGSLSMPCEGCASPRGSPLWAVQSKRSGLAGCWLGAMQGNPG
ncbi:hypothetical protein LZ31DRAFT_205808 [Colletotrichum somersetense]|nr:hypothetical protein LZ31DRAFT_205808 [Colletotrichum somersetense]